MKHWTVLTFFFVVITLLLAMPAGAGAAEAVRLCQVLTLEDGPVEGPAESGDTSVPEEPGDELAPGGIEPLPDIDGGVSDFDSFDQEIPALESITPLLQSLLQQGDFHKVLESEAFSEFMDFDTLRKHMEDGSLKDLAADGRIEEIFNPGAVDKLLGDENFQRLMATPQFQQLINNFSTMDMNRELDLDSVREGDLGSYLNSVLGESGDVDPDLVDSVMERFETMEELLEE